MSKSIEIDSNNTNKVLCDLNFACVVKSLASGSTLQYCGLIYPLHSQCFYHQCSLCFLGPLGESAARIWEKKLWTLLNIFISLSVQHLGWLIFFFLVLWDPPSAVVLYTHWAKKQTLVWLAMTHNLVWTSPPLSAEILCIQCAKMRLFSAKSVRGLSRKCTPSYITRQSFMTIWG